MQVSLKKCKYVSSTEEEGTATHGPRAQWAPCLLTLQILL